MKFYRYRTTPFFIAIWGLAIWLLYQDVESQSFLTRDAKVDINNGALIMRQDYLGFYLGNQKIGYSRFVLREDNDESEVKLPGKYYLFKSNAFMQIQALGITQEMKIEQSGVVNEDLTMRSFTLNFQASGQRLYTHGQMKEDGLHLTSKSEGATTEHEPIPIEQPVYHTDLVHLLVAREGLEIGKEYTYRVYDPLTMSKGQVAAKVDSTDDIQLPDGKTVSAYKVNVNFKGMNSTVWIDKNGQRYKEVSQVSGIVFTALRESKEEATDMNFVSDDVKGLSTGQPNESVDLIEASRIKSNVQFRNPAAVREMKAKLSYKENANSGKTLKENMVFDGSYQSLIEEKEDSVVINVKQLDYSPLTGGLPENQPPFEVADESLQKYLKEEILIQSNNPKVRGKAMEVAGGAKNEWEAVDKIATWLYQNIKKELRATIPSAVEILKTMKGDCNEHSTLLAAMARSIGIPTKIAAGLVYHEDGFYYHAWNELYINGKWWPVDSTLDRIEMDAAHIKMAEGSTDAQADIVNMIGNIDVEVMSYKEQV